LQHNLAAGIVAGLLIGLLVGAINGFLVTQFNIPSFLVTLGMLSVASGIAQYISATAPIPILDTTYNNIFGSGQIGGVPSLLIWSLVFLSFQWGTGDELSVIAAVILGGTSLFGGAGSVVGSVFGALLIGLINNGLILMNLSVSEQLIVQGAIIILAVALGRKGAS
jgi:ribose/xylose/arabinose/galactoside ABC-type transport system permease subunit